MIFKRGNIDMFKYLAMESDFKNPVTHSQTTPLHLAAKFGHLKILEYLMDFVENLDIQDVDGWTPLHLAVKARVLIKNQSNLNPKKIIRISSI